MARDDVEKKISLTSQVRFREFDGEGIVVHLENGPKIQAVASDRLCHLPLERHP